MSSDIPQRQRRSQEEWRQLVAQFHESGLSRQQFCQSQGVSLARLEKWDIFFRRESHILHPSPFMDLGTIGPAAVAAPSSRLEVRLDLGGGMVMTLSRA
ncbi:hypothetical protein [Ferrovum sp.]|uniref:IS66 family insertion sequence element accessory protein TnpA n=1 Tax=Ferrovum sp. TaxID=2609467 RepID=UPI002615CEBE|nr:hypothetical protein [Ferrovum sp.]